MPKWNRQYEKGRKYKVEWERDFVWVSADEGSDKAYCKLCRRSVLAKRDSLVQHSNSTAHKSRTPNASASKPLTNFFQRDNKKSTQRIELILATHTACHTAIRTIDHLGEILASNGKKSDFSDLKLHRTKCTRLITEVIAPAFKETMVEDIADKKFSLIIDETTDISSEKELAIIIRFYSEKNQKIMDTLLEMVPMCSATGETIFEAITGALQKCGLPLANCIGLGCDGASTMVGQFNSVWSRLRAQNPECVLMRCVCHSLALCIQHGFDKLPSNLSYLLQEIPGWFSHSKLRREGYKQLQEEMMDDDSVLETPFTRFAQTRWLSRGKVMSRIHKNWSVLQEYFSVMINTDSQKLNAVQRYKAREILNMLLDKANHLYLTFALPIVTEFERVNAFFQADKADPNVALDELNCLFRSLKTRVSDSHGNEKALSLVDFGAQFAAESQEFLRSSHDAAQSLQNIKGRCLDLLKECISEVEKRLPDQKNVFLSLTSLGPGCVLSQTRRSTFANLPFQHLLRENVNELDEQYRQVIFVDWKDHFPDSQIPTDSESFWTGVLKYEDAAGNKKFRMLALYALSCLSIPLSNAVVERLFSTVTFV